MRRQILGPMMFSLVAIGLVAHPAVGAERWGLNKVGPELSSAGSLAMGPDGVLLIADAKQAAVLAVQTDVKSTKNAGTLSVENLTAKIAEEAGVDPKSVAINDLVVHQESATGFLSVDISTDNGKQGQIWVVNGSDVRPLEMAKLNYAELKMPNPPEDKIVGQGRRQRNPRDESITGLTYAEGRVLVSGLSADDNPSSVWEFQFPFAESTSATNVEIYHAAHGKYEDTAAIRTFVTMDIGGKPSLLAGYTCTPLVKLPLDSLKDGSKVRGTTVAELGNWNRPLDMLVYEADGKTFVLMSNSARGMMRISTEGIESNEGLSEPVKDGGQAGQQFETLEPLNNVTKMDRLGPSKFVALVKQDDESLSLSTFDLP